jgi:hypothetical protein
LRRLRDNVNFHTWKRKFFPAGQFETIVR